MELRDDQPQAHEIGRRTYLVADVEPLDVDGVRTVQVGVALWVVGFVALRAVGRSAAPPSDLVDDARASTRGAT